MLLKIILFLIIGFALYKMFGGKFTLPRSKDDSKTMVVVIVGGSDADIWI
ncbi:MAG: hypothetical protein P8Y35_08540 [Sulfurovaceae bacterium]